MVSHSEVKLMKRKIVLIVLLLMSVSVSYALEVKSPYLVKTQWGTTNTQWSQFQYLDNGKVKSTPLYWYWTNFTYVNVSKIYSTPYYSEVNTTYATFVAHKTSWVDIKRMIREYKNRAFTEVMVTANSSGNLVAMFPNFPITANGEFILVPGLSEPKVTYKGDATDTNWPSVIGQSAAGNMADNYVLMYDRGKSTTLLIMSKKLYGMTSYDLGNRWQTYFAMWKFQNVVPGKTYSFEYWLTPIHIGYNDDIATIKKKAGNLAHQALCTPVVVNRSITRGYDYTAYEVSYRFEKEKNDWGIDPFTDSPYNYLGEKVNDTGACAIYLPKGAIAMSGKDGLPAVFASTGKNAIGMYFKDSINGPRGKHDMWFANESAGGGFYIKKSGLKDGGVIKVYYMVPSKAVVESMNVTIPETSAVLSEAALGKGGYKLIVADEGYVKFAKEMILVSVLALLAGIAAVVWVAVHKRMR